MVELRGGPAGGVTLALRRAPRFLRVVIDPAGAVDALDQLEDTPTDGELVEVYELLERRGPVHVCARRGGGSGWYESASYTFRGDVDGNQLRDTAAWRAWAAAQPPAAG